MCLQTFKKPVAEGNTQFCAREIPYHVGHNKLFVQPKDRISIRNCRVYACVRARACVHVCVRVCVCMCVRVNISYVNEFEAEQTCISPLLWCTHWAILVEDILSQRSNVLCNIGICIDSGSKQKFTK